MCNHDRLALSKPLSECYDGFEYDSVCRDCGLHVIITAGQHDDPRGTHTPDEPDGTTFTQVRDNEKALL